MQVELEGLGCHEEHGLIDIKRVEREVGVACDLQGLELHNELSSFVPGLHGPREMFFKVQDAERGALPVNLLQHLCGGRGEVQHVR